MTDTEIRRHAGNPKLINIKGLRIVEMPGCEGGGYALTGDIAEHIVKTLSAPPVDVEWLLEALIPSHKTRLDVHCKNDIALILRVVDHLTVTGHLPAPPEATAMMEG